MNVQTRPAEDAVAIVAELGRRGRIEAEIRDTVAAVVEEIADRSSVSGSFSAGEGALSVSFSEDGPE